MNDQKNILTQFNLGSLVLARSNLYAFVSIIYSDPTSVKFQSINDQSFQELLKENLREHGMTDYVSDEPLEELAEKIFLFVRKNKTQIQDEYVTIFGHTLSKQTAPYELEHLKNEDVFFRTQCLADLSGFYKAFGLEIDKKERADHISVQAEFLSNVFVKEWVAREQNLGHEKIEVCQKAQLDFWNDHFYEWTKIFTLNMITQTRGCFYPMASQFVKAFLTFEKSVYNTYKKQ